MSPINEARRTQTAARPVAKSVTGAAPAANGSKPVARPLIANDELRTAPRAPKPGIAPAPSNVRLTAAAGMDEPTPKFKSPEDYKNYIIKYKGYHETAKAELNIAVQAQEAEKQRLSDADAEFSKPLNAAKKVLQDTHNLYQQPVDRISSDLRSANEALQDAIYPGRRRAAELDADATRLQNAISSLDREINGAQGRIGTLSGIRSSAMSRMSGARSDRSEAESRIRSLEPQAPSEYELSNQRSRVNDAAARLRDADTRVSSANSALSKKRSVESQISNLQSALDSVKSAESELSGAKSSASGFKGHVTRAENKLESAMALPESDASKPVKVTAARSEMSEASSKYESALSHVRSLEGKIAQYGSASSVSSQISSLRSQLSQYAGAESDYASATSAKNSAQQSYNDTKRRFDDMSAIDTELDQNRNKLSTANRTINDANAQIISSEAEMRQKNTEISQTQDLLRTKTDEKSRVVAQANQQRTLQNPETHPQVVSSNKRVGDLQNELKSAQDTYNTKIAAPKAKVDEEQKVYNEKLAPFRAKVVDAERTVGTARQALDGFAAKFDKLKDAVGFWKGLWWKLVHHASPAAIWEQHGKLSIK